MTTGKRPDGTVFASGAAEGEVQDFPATARGWGVTIDGKDESGTAVTDATNSIPPMEWFNGLLKRIDENVWWLLQNALPDWLAGIWPKGAVVVNGDIVWRAQKETATEPTSSNGDWLALFPLQNLDGRYVPQTRKINGHALNADANVTAKDIFNDQAVVIGDAVDLNTLTTPGLYYQGSNAQAASGQNYPEPNAGSLEVYKHAGITQVYRIYLDSRSYIRTLYNGTWSAWTKQYDAANKPTPADIGAVSVNGGDVDHLSNASFYHINPAAWPGAGAFAEQYSNPVAPFIIPYGRVTPKDNSQYLPIVKALSSTEGYGYGAAVSFGILRTGNADFGSAVINIIGDNGNAAVYSFDINGAFNAPGKINSGGGLYAAGQIDSGGNIVAGQGLYESGGAVRAYSSNNPPPPTTTNDMGAGGGWWLDNSTGLIMQMGIVNRADYGTAVAFPRAFPNFCLGVLLTLNMYIDSLKDSSGNIRVLSRDQNGFVYGAPGTPEATSFWVAFGK